MVVKNSILTIVSKSTYTPSELGAETDSKNQKTKFRLVFWNEIPGKLLLGLTLWDPNTNEDITYACRGH